MCLLLRGGSPRLGILPRVRLLEALRSLLRGCRCIEYSRWWLVEIRNTRWGYNWVQRSLLESSDVVIHRVALLLIGCRHERQWVLRIRPIRLRHRRCVISHVVLTISLGVVVVPITLLSCLLVLLRVVRRLRSRILSRVEHLRRLLRNRTSSSDSFNLLNGQVILRFFLVLLTESLVLFVDVHDELLHVVASNLILVKEARAYAQMQRLIAFFLLRSFLKARTFASQAKLHEILKLIVRSSLAANFDNALHVTTFSSD